MASYHRILQVFDRSVEGKNVECNCDIHPWEILINEERWSGKIRLIGFVDVFFLISYATNDRFEHGIIIYKDDDAIRSTLKDAGVAANDISLNLVNKEIVKNKKAPEKYFSLIGNDKGSLDYTIVSLGHPVSLSTEYPRSALQKFEIKLRKNKDPSMAGPILRGINQHTIPELMHDVVRLGIVSNAEMTAHLVNQLMSGTHTEDTMRKWMAALGGPSRVGHGAISG